MNRRKFLRGTVAFSAGIGGVIGLNRTPPAEAAESPADGAGIPRGQFGKYRIGRLIVGANQFTGYPHADPLIYARELFAAYFTREKIVETLAACMENGIDTHITLTDPFAVDYLKLLEKTTGKRIHWIAQTLWFPGEPGLAGNKVIEYIKTAADNGAIACFLQGAACDGLVAAGNLGDLDRYISAIRKSGMMAGVCGHLNETVRAVKDAGIKPDFYMKTINNVNYNAPDPEVTGEMMRGIELPWIAFKVLAAGRVHPREGFRFALEAGADFLNVGMFDFQVAENAKIFKECLSKTART